MGTVNHVHVHILCTCWNDSLLNPCSTGEVVEIFTRVHTSVQVAQYEGSHLNTALGQADISSAAVVAVTSTTTTT